MFAKKKYKKNQLKTGKKTRGDEYDFTFDVQGLKNAARTSSKHTQYKVSIVVCVPIS